MIENNQKKVYDVRQNLIEQWQKINSEIFWKKYKNFFV